jgi:hypothetical protein
LIATGTGGAASGGSHRTSLRRDAGERSLSYSDSDAAAGVGQRPRKASQVMAFGDAFSLMRHYEARNDFRRALDRARSE